MERHDKALARALGIRAKQEGSSADSVLGNPEMEALCKGRDWRGIKMLVGSFLQGWKVQHDLQVTFGKSGTVGFSTQEEAEKYLMAMPVNYAGATRKTPDGKWRVAYQRITTLSKLEVGATTLRRNA